MGRFKEEQKLQFQGDRGRSWNASCVQAPSRSPIEIGASVPLEAGTACRFYILKGVEE